MFVSGKLRILGNFCTGESLWFKNNSFLFDLENYSGMFTLRKWELPEYIYLNIDNGMFVKNCVRIFVLIRKFGEKFVDR